MRYFNKHPILQLKPPTLQNTQITLATITVIIPMITKRKNMMFAAEWLRNTISVT